MGLVTEFSGNIKKTTKGRHHPTIVRELMKDVTSFCFWLTSWYLGVQCKQFSGTVGGPQVIKMVSWETTMEGLFCMQMEACGNLSAILPFKIPLGSLKGFAHGGQQGLVQKTHQRMSEP